MSITVRNVTKRFGSFTALDGVTSIFRAGGWWRCSARRARERRRCCASSRGSKVPTAERSQFDGHDISDRSARERRVGFVFQHYALFRHMRVFENVAFGLRVRPRGRGRREQRSGRACTSCWS